MDKNGLKIKENDLFFLKETEYNLSRGVVGLVGQARYPEDTLGLFIIVGDKWLYYFKNEIFDNVSAIREIGRNGM